MITRLFLLSCLIASGCFTSSGCNSSSSSSSSQTLNPDMLKSNQSQVASDQGIKPLLNTDSQISSAACAAGVFNEGAFEFLFYEGNPAQPIDSGESNGVPSSRVLTVTDRKYAEGDKSTRPPLLFIDYLGTTESTPEAQISFILMQGWDITTKVGDVLQYKRLHTITECQDQSLTKEWRWVSEAVLRTQDGKLLAVSGDTPFTSDGKTLFVTSLVPEIEVSWVDMGCPISTESQQTDGGGLRPVGLKVRAVSGGSEATVTWGRRATLQINGEPYVLAVNQSWVYANGQGCSTSHWMLYRQGYFFETNQNE